jgi:hypothetical protein
MKQLIVLILILITFSSCNNNENSCGQAYLGGEIINPNNDYLKLYEGSKFIDTIYLDKNNRFSYLIESLNPGLYTISHGGEAQFSIIEPNDSLMIRLNTFDFDESFVLSGRGSKKNNYLLNLFLSLDKENRVVYNYSKLEPEQFVEKLDSMRTERYHSLNSFNERYQTSDLFKKISKLSVDFSYYRRKEIYPLNHFGNNVPIHAEDLPEGYYDFRKHIDYNDEELTEFYPFYYFLFNHFNNLASEKYFKDSGDSILVRTNIDYNLNKLELMDNLVRSVVIKNILIKYSTSNFLSNSKSFEDSELMYNSYTDKNTNQEYGEFITNLFNTIKRLKPGNALPEVEVFNIKNKSSTLNSIINKPTVLYFWSNANKHYYKSSHKKVDELRIDYPEVDFISLNINSNNASVWKRLLKQNHFDYNYEYRFKNPQVAKKLLAIQYINKIIIVDKNANIVTSNGDIFSKNFKYLLGKLN